MNGSEIAGGLFRRLRKMNGLTQMDIARMVDRKSSSTISDWETGKQSMTIQDMERYGSVFGMSLNVVLELLQLEWKSKQLSLWASRDFGAVGASPEVREASASSTRRGTVDKGEQSLRLAVIDQLIALAKALRESELQE